MGVTRYVSPADVAARDYCVAKLATTFCCQPDDIRALLLLLDLEDERQAPIPVHEVLRMRGTGALSLLILANADLAETSTGSDGALTIAITHKGRFFVGITTEEAHGQTAKVHGGV